MELNDPKIIKELINEATQPIVLKNVCKWPILKWNLDKWLQNLPQDEVPFRCKPKSSASLEPSWERVCPVKKFKFKDVFEAGDDGKDWAYFDYKYMHHWFTSDDELFKQTTWDSFGFPELAANDSTIWIGTKGAHTPCHQDTYGRNVVVQIFGRKQWMLFPPETDGLKPTRIPYEESSIYSSINFSHPDVDSLKNVFGCRMISLEPGDALIVPPKWWHYVENTSSVGISINTWIACEKLDVESRVEEALIRLFVAQICKDLPPKSLAAVLNPNEDDLIDLPLTAAILQIDATVNKYIQFRSSKAKRRRHSTETETLTIDVDDIIAKYDNVCLVGELNRDEFTSLLKSKTTLKRKFESQESSSSDDCLETDGLVTNLINSFCQPSIIKTIKDNLLSRY